MKKANFHNSLSLMFKSSMLFELLHIAASKLTSVTSKPFIIKMQLLVTFQTGEELGGISADAANKGLFIKVNPAMRFHVILVLEFFVA